MVTFEHENSLMRVLFLKLKSVHMTVPGEEKRLEARQPEKQRRRLDHGRFAAFRTKLTTAAELVGRVFLQTFETPIDSQIDVEGHSGNKLDAGFEETIAHKKKLKSGGFIVKVHDENLRKLTTLNFRVFDIFFRNN